MLTARTRCFGHTPPLKAFLCDGGLPEHLPYHRGTTAAVQRLMAWLTASTALLRKASQQAIVPGWLWVTVSLRANNLKNCSVAELAAPTIPTRKRSAHGIAI